MVPQLMRRLQPLHCTTSHQNGSQTERFLSGYQRTPRGPARHTISSPSPPPHPSMALALATDTAAKWTGDGMKGHGGREGEEWGWEGEKWREVVDWREGGVVDGRSEVVEGREVGR